jgi:hypothetical protein
MGWHVASIPSLIGIRLTEQMDAYVNLQRLRDATSAGPSWHGFVAVGVDAF